MGVPELRKEILGQCDVLQAILAFNYHLDESHQQLLAHVRASAPTAAARVLRDVRDELREDIRNAAKTFGLRGKPRDFADWFKNNYRNEKGTLQLPKWMIETQYFSNFGATPKAWAMFPHHAQIALAFDGSFGTVSPQYYLPEVALYEDMCVAYNMAVASRDALRKEHLNKVETKTHYFHLRASVLSAFYFVEAYLNGIVFDYWWEHRTRLRT
jgi:hypothetical protein